MIFGHVTVENYRSIEHSGDIKLGPITVLVGRNNSGKSSLIRAMYLLQQSAPFADSDIRHGSAVMHLVLQLVGKPRLNLASGEEVPHQYGDGKIALSMTNTGLSKFVAEDDDENTIGLSLASSAEPNNLIFPVLSGRRPHTLQQQVNRVNATTVGHQDSYVFSKIAELLANDLPESRRFRDICKRALGLNFGVINTSNNNQTLGVKITRYQEILIEAMGAGLAAALNLIASLSTATGQLFLIEEPENDLHPAALKVLLREIINSSDTNQFVISTHSNIVLSALGSIPDTSVVEVTSDDGAIPTSSYTAITDAESRLRVLRDLGYELSDFGLGQGWLIFEESTAELLIRNWFIPVFAPSLAILRTVAASGVSRIRPMFRDIQEMFLFAHLEKIYKGRVWVIADGDEAGREATDQLKKSYKTWDPSHFANWDKDNFEFYYPSDFAEDVSRVLAIGDGVKKKAAKGKLVEKVWAWIRADEARARTAFESSAAPVIDTLRAIEKQMHGLGSAWNLSEAVEKDSEQSQAPF
ncbi:ATP-dependent nuclease [Actinoplanes friuliensis]|uniref:ATPase AAA-type core domain-containing protein n=1 Tax=Actinoplanes friuliensis DSM 7358 TaxID=1246995 RepID=U5WCL5_9ACTN|nr:AAA family ATPase [Actinoplanes friuliensis]AGZ46712.1 hypothetical protein AFR_42290 [Actinoplanes friuliensis DSM 7358]